MVWISSTLTVVAVAAALSRRLHPAGEAARVLDVTIICWTCIVAVAIPLGTARILSGPNLLIGVLVVAAALLSLLLLKPDRLGRLSTGSGREAQAARQPDPTAGQAWPLWAMVLWTVLLAFWGGHVVTRGLMRFPTDFDTLMYHIPLVDYWLQAGSLYAPNGKHWYNPGGNELLGLWAVALFPSDFLITLNNIPAALLLAFGTLELGGLLGLSGTLRHPVAFAVVSNVVVVNQLADAENDVAVAGLLVASLCYGLRFGHRGRTADLCLFGTSLGLLCGIKYYALGYAAVVWAVVASLAAWQRGFSSGMLAAVGGGLGAVTLGGYWYVRNLLASGSPLYPLGLVPGTDVLHQIYPHAWRSSFLGNGRPEIWPLALRAVWRMAGPAYLAAILAMPSVIGWLGATAFRAAGRRETSAVRLGLVALTIGSAGVLGMTPFALEDVPGSLNHLRWCYTPIRYGLSFLVLALTGLALVLQDLATVGVAAGRRWPGLASLIASCPHVLLCGSTACQLALIVWRHEIDIDWITDVLVCTNVLAALLLWRRLREDSRGLRWWTIVSLTGIAVVVGAAGIGRLARAWNEKFTNFYNSNYCTRIFSVLESLEPAPDRLVAFDYRIQPFFGGRRQFRLGQPGRVPSYDWLRRYLDEHGATHVVVRSHERRRPAGWDVYQEVGRWVSEHPDHFELVHRDRTFSLYRVIHSPADNLSIGIAPARLVPHATPQKFRF